MFVQGLLLVKRGAEFRDGTNEPFQAGRKFEGYTLVSPASREGSPLRLLNPVTSPDEVAPPPNTHYELVEVWTDTSSSKLLYVDPWNFFLARCVFSRDSNISFFTQPPTYGKRHWALDDGNLENLEAIGNLLRPGVTVTHRRPEGGTLAHFAAERGFHALITVLEKCGADLNAPRDDGLTPLHIAVMQKNLRTVDVLLECGASPNGKIGKRPGVNVKLEGDLTPLFVAAALGMTAIAESLLERGASVDAKFIDGSDSTSTPLLITLEKKRWLTAAVLVKHGARLQVSCNGRNPLYLAVSEHSEELLDQLLDRRDLDVESPENMDAILLCFSEGYFGLSLNNPQNLLYIKKLTDRGFLIPAGNPRVLSSAIYHKNNGIVEKILEAGVDVNVILKFQDFPDLMSPLVIALSYGTEEICQSILDYDGKLGNQIPPLEMIWSAVWSRNVEVVRMFLRKNFPACDHPSLLICALRRSGWEVTELLLDNGCPVLDPTGVDLRTAKSLNPLYVAFKENAWEGVKILMKYGSPYIFDLIDFYAELNTHGRDIPLNRDFFEEFLTYGFLDLDGPSHRNICQQLRSNIPVRDAGRRLTPNKDELEMILRKHLLKLVVAGKTVGDIATPPRFQKILDTSKRHFAEELERLKSKEVPNSGNLTLFDVLMKNLKDFAYLRNDKVRESLSNVDFKREFPHYGGIIECKVRQGNWRRQLFFRGLKAFDRLMVRLPELSKKLPLEVKEAILSLLENQDFITLELCCKLE